MAECETCINHDSYVCHDCVHSEHPLGDLYIKASPEIIAKREAENRKRLIASISGREIAVKLPQDFVGTFNRIVKYADKETPKFLAVYAGQTSLTASNGHYVIELYCCVPRELHNKPILHIANNIATTATTCYAYSKLTEQWNPANIIKSPKLVYDFILKNLNLETKRNGYYYLQPTNQLCIVIDSELMDPIVEELVNINIVGYGNEREPVLISSSFLNRR